MTIDELAETVAPLQIKAEGHCEWDRNIYCDGCGLRQQYWGIECYEMYEKGEFPDWIVDAVRLYEERGDDDTAAKMCYWFFGWRALDGKSYCMACHRALMQEKGLIL